MSRAQPPAPAHSDLDRRGNTSRLPTLAHLLAWGSVMALPALLLRIGALAGHAGTGRGDLRGFVSDLLVSVVVGSGVALSARLCTEVGEVRTRRRSSPARGMAVALVLAPTIGWTLLLVANAEHVRALGGPATLDHAAFLVDPTFVAGSALPILLAPSTVLLLALVSIGSILILRSGLGTGSGGKGDRLALPALVLGSTLALAIWVPSPMASDWRQSHVVEHNIRLYAFGHGTDGGEEEGDPIEARRAETDLDGPPIVDRAPGRNVILVLIEGASNGHLPTPASRQGFGGAPPFLPLFDQALVEVASKAAPGPRPRLLYFEHFFNPQRQTNRGEYALLCGDPPKLRGGEPKMSEAIRTGAPERLGCLPEALAEAGYRTVYFQASPLPFMLKDQFMPKAGFQQVMGDESILEARRRNEWGVDDRTFFEHGQRLIEELGEAEEPYFLTLLTVGTHHPYNAPPEHASSFPTGSLPWAFSYLDPALASFVHWLDRSHVLDDTLVLFLSDESAGFGRAPDVVTELIAQAWGLGVALVPGDERAKDANRSGEPLFLSQPFVQTDLPLSILDHLDLPLDQFGGRSLFRSYPNRRDLSFGNVYLRRLAHLDPEGRLTSCDPELDGCTAWQLEPERLFSFRRLPLEPRPEARKSLDRSARSSQRMALGSNLEGAAIASPGANRDTRYELVRESRARLLPTGYRQWIFAGQFFDFPAEAEVEVRIRVSVEGEADTEGQPARVWLIHDLFAAEGTRLYEQGVELAADQGVEFAYRLAVGPESIERVESRLWTARYRGQDVALRIHHADLEIRPPVHRSETPSDPLLGSPRVLDGAPTFFEVDSSEPDPAR